MDPITGLPMAFGKQKADANDTTPSIASRSGDRGGAGGGRGSRGVVGGGKRSRGRGGGRGGGDVGGSGERSEGEAVSMNGGVKRPHPSSASHSSLPPTPQSYPPGSSYGYPTSSRSNPNGMGLGQRGGGPTRGGFVERGGGHVSSASGRGGSGGYGSGRGGRGGRGREEGGSRGGGGGGRGGGHAPPERGFYKPSFAEDPWKELLEARERAAARVGHASGERSSRSGVAAGT